MSLWQALNFQAPPSPVALRYSETQKISVYDRHKDQKVKRSFYFIVFIVQAGKFVTNPTDCIPSVLFL